MIRVGVRIDLRYIQTMGILVLFACLAAIPLVQPARAYETSLGATSREYGMIQPLISREYIGRQTVISWVPAFVLYDPPGDGSYAKFTQTKTVTTTFSYGGTVPGYSVSGSTTQAWDISVSYSTPSNQRMHCVICGQFEQQWDVWYYESPISSWYTAALVPNTTVNLHGQGIFTFNELSANHLWVTDLTGVSGQYCWARHVGANCTLTNTFEYFSSNSVQPQVGYQIAPYGILFSIYVGTKTVNEQRFTVEYTYHSSNTLDFFLESNYNINWDTEPPQSVNGIQIWFDR
jgi:hypothetical protein